ncbi:hypothetical protein SAMN05216262_11419 [Colwellia chukchiensis]|uniref:Uncharacterized protein n=1 Tax=Colwellia chukchiensis TaxID=641665 RepID=A0A1H7R9M9_9GAMM|nr:YheU family protein [Colwellia chukchiensis]SEL56990.1 hypothetical protein SAMN05216262_11419 [Colwellia chukchiensis]
MIIPLERIDHETLMAIIESFVLREGTEYGSEDVTLSDKIAAVHTQLKQGSAVLVYSQLHETVNILPAEQFIDDSAENP